ncbi:MAG TPA: hypothetical protein VF077_12770 [Nitrospiraceae bacterium]
MKKARAIESPDREEESYERRLAADPFYTLGQVRAIAERPAVKGISGSSSSRLAEIRAVLRAFKVATDAKKAAGKSIFIGVAR